MSKLWLSMGLLVLMISHVALANLRIGLPDTAPPFVMQNGTPGILDDELSILLSNTSAPEIHHFTTLSDAVEALRTHQIDLLIADRPPAGDLQPSELMLTFPLASLSLKRGSGDTLCFPDPPVSLAPYCTQLGSANITDNVQRMIQGKARRIIAPEFILRSWLSSAPATTLLLETQENFPPLHYRGWVLPESQSRLAVFNAHINSITSEDAHWLEKKWLLPTGSVFSARNPPTNENAPRLMLKILLPSAPTPLVQLTPDGHIRGVWYDLLLSLFPANHFSLSFGIDFYHVPLPKHSGRAILRIVASLSPPSPDAIAFDSLNWGLVSTVEKALPGALPALQNQRIAVIRHSPLAAMLRLHLPEENLVFVKDFPQGVELMRAGGADGVAGDAYALNYFLQQHKDTTLQLTPLDLPETRLWFVPDISNAADARRVTAILSSVSRSDIVSHRAKPLALLNEQPLPPTRSLWLIILAVVSFFAALVALIVWSTAQRQRLQREQDTSALHNALTLWQTLMNNAPVPLFICDPSGRLTRYNDAFLHAPQLANAPKEGSPLAQLPLGELAVQLALPQRLTLLNTIHPLTGETRISNDNTTLYWWLCRYTDSLGRPQGIVGGWVDISEKASLTAALNQALAQAERANREKSDFLARMSHDIRTPLNAVLGLLELEKDNNDTLTVAWQAAGSLRDLIGDILDISRIEAGELHLEQATYNLWQTLNASAEIFAHSATDKGLNWRTTLDIPQDTLFYFDKARLNQIVSNLLGNAIKYTLQGEVRFDAKFEAETLRLSIRDTGIGIPPEDMPSIGQPWFQTDRTMPQSSGLGLAICYQLVGLMGGSLKLGSIQGEGTEVIVLLPLTLAREQQVSVKALPSLPHYKVMIVDDFPVNLTVMGLQLEKLGLQKTVCESASEALVKLANEPVDILITDCQMPDIDGYQLTTQLLILDIAGLAHAPRIILGCTANALLEENDRARHAGMDALLRKPLTIESLRLALIKYGSVQEDTPDLTGLQQLADGRTDVMLLMRQQMCDSLAKDVQQLEVGMISAETLSHMAHKLKASWALFNMREATRCCQALEALPELISAGLIEQKLLPTIATRFLALMRESLALLETALEELSDKY